MKIQYQDKWLRIIGYPLLGFIVRHFGEYESIGTLMKQSLYYGDLLWNTLIVALSWEDVYKRQLSCSMVDSTRSWAHVI